MVQISSTSVGQDRRNQQQWSHHPQKEARIHHNRTNVSVISVSVKPDEAAPHGRNNGGKASNHERINDQRKTCKNMINYDKQRDLYMHFYEISKYYDQSEMNVMPVYQLGDIIPNQQLTPACGLLFVFNSYTFLFSVLCYVVPIFQHCCPITSPNMMIM